MDQEPPVRVWANKGTDDPPLLWGLRYLPAAFSEARILTENQYWHVADQLRDLARSPDPHACDTVDIAKMTTFWELKEKGGPLGKINLRVFFLVDSANKVIVILGVHKKEDEAQLRRSVVVRIERRARMYEQRVAKQRS